MFGFALHTLDASAQNAHCFLGLILLDHLFVAFCCTVWVSYQPPFGGSRPHQRVRAADAVGAVHRPPPAAAPAAGALWARREPPAALPGRARAVLQLEGHWDWEIQDF